MAWVGLQLAVGLAKLQVSWASSSFEVEDIPQVQVYQPSFVTVWVVQPLELLVVSASLMAAAWVEL